MEKLRKPSPTYLFTVRLSLEDLGNGQTEWRGEVKNLASGQGHYFRTWSALARLVRAMLPSSNNNNAPQA